MCQKRPIYVSKETYLRVKRDLCGDLKAAALHVRRQHSPAVCVSVKRGLIICQKRPNHMPKEAHYISQKRPKYMPKEA